MSMKHYQRGTAGMWAEVKRGMLEQIQKNQPVPLRRFIVGTSIMTGLTEEKVVAYVKQFQEAGLVRINKKDEIQMEEGAESILGFK